jgi:hypothetical protein
MPSIFPLEIFMKNKLLSTVIVLVLSTLLLSACNLPSRQTIQAGTPTPITAAIPESSPTPSSQCDNQYFPNTIGDAWEYSGTNSAIGAYTRTDNITNSGAESFTQVTTQSNVTYSVTYTCSSTGLTSTNPIQQYAGALLSGPNAPVNVSLTSNSGTSLPARITPGDTWQQTADWNATSPELNLNGRFIFDYTAVGYESVTVPFGTFNALHVDAIIKIEVSGFRILAGTYSTTTWLVPDVGIVKSEGTSHVPGVDFADSMELTRLTPAP